jgi:hypothetical protein
MPVINVKLPARRIMMNKILIIVMLILSAVCSYPQDNDKLSDLEKRIDALEKKNNDLEIELEETKRSIADNTSDASGDLNKVAIQKDQWGKEFAFEFSGGLQGVYSQFNLGVVFPKIKNALVIGMGINFSASIIPMISFDKTKQDINSYFYSVVSAYFKIGGTSPLFFNFIRVYGYGELLLGARIQNQGMDLTKNSVTLTVGGLGYGGIEFYTSRWCAMFFEAGGGYMAFFTIEKTDDQEFKNIKVNSESGSNGFAFNIGVKVFLAKKKK